jgi:hypothetical protein
VSAELDRLETLERHGMLTNAQDQGALDELRAKSAKKAKKKAKKKAAAKTDTTFVVKPPVKKATPVKKTPAKKAASNGEAE